MSLRDATTPPLDDRKTRELCGHEHVGLRCMRQKGHDDAHEAYTAVRTVTWK